MKRLSEIQTAIRSERLDGWLLYDFRGMNAIAQETVGMAVGHGPSRRWACYVPAQGDPRWLVHAIEQGSLRNLAPNAHVYVSWVEWREGLRELLGGAQRVAMEVSPGAAVPTVSRVDAGTVDLVRSLGVEVVTSADLVQVATAVWSTDQLATHRRAADALIAIQDATFAYVRHCLAAGQPVTEMSIQRFMLEEFARHSLDTESPPIVGVNAHAADPHFTTRPESDASLQAGDFLLLDLWGREPRANAIYGDITWVGYAGSQVPPRIQSVFEVVRQARDAAVSFARGRLRARQSVYGYEVDDVARGVIAGAGFGPYFIHRTGHSIGTTDHGTGVNIDNLETQDRRRLIPGVGFSVEPGIYLPGEGFGVRLEIDCFVSDADLEVTTLPLQNEIVLLA
jgi:Xaa-Pro aminopeptidase